MSYEFEFNGGIEKISTHVSEKFLLFFVVGGQEIPLYQMQKESLVVKDHALVEPLYRSGNNVMKLFVSQQGFGVPKRFHSFYLRLITDPHPVVTMSPFSGKKSTMFLKGKFSFLKKTEVMSLLAEECPSAYYLKRQGPLPTAVLQSMCAVDKTALTEDVRHVRINNSNGRKA